MIERPGDRACRDHSTWSSDSPASSAVTSSTMLRARTWAVRPIRSRITPRLAWCEELLRDAVQPHGRVDARRVQGLQQHRAAAADDAVVLDADRPAGAGAARSRSAGSTGLTQRGSTTVTPMPWATSRSATSTAVIAIEPTPTISTSVGAVAGQHVAAAGRPTRLDVGARRALREPDDGRGVVDLRRPRAAAPADAAPSRGAARRSPGTTWRIDMSHMPLWRGAVVTGHAGAVQHEGHAAAGAARRPSAPGRRRG